MQTRCWNFRQSKQINGESIIQPSDRSESAAEMQTLICNLTHLEQPGKQ
jgi:hypothetical protein